MKIKNKKEPIKFRLQRGWFGWVKIFITTTEFLDPLDPYLTLTHEVERPATIPEIEEIIRILNAKSGKI